MYDKSDQHNTVFDSYNIEVALKKIKTLPLENAANTYSAFNGIKFDLEDKHDKYLLHRQFVAWVCNGCSIAPLTDYSNNEMHRELPKQKEYFSSSDEKLYIDLRRSKGYTDELEILLRNDSDFTLTITLKAAAAATKKKKKKLRVTGYYQGEYLYTLSRSGLLMSYKEYGI